LALLGSGVFLLLTLCQQQISKIPLARNVLVDEADKNKP
jgi:hypothetical protein